MPVFQSGKFNPLYFQNLSTRERVMNYTAQDYLVLLETCQITEGLNRNILIDYAHDGIYDLEREHVQLLDMLKTNPILKVQEEFEDEESRKNFKEFLKFLISQEMAFVTPHPEKFPNISKHLHNDSLRIIDSIIEVSSTTRMEDIDKFCYEISELGCQEIVVWLVNDPIAIASIKKVLDILGKHGFSYIEVHGTHTGEMTLRETAWSLVEQYASLKRLYLYSSDKANRVDVVNQVNGFAPMSLGEIIHVKEDFEDGKCCGQIHFNSLDFSGYWVANMLLKKNGCLYKKISLTKNGTIMNCPCLNVAYGHIQDTVVKDVIQSKKFRLWGDIKKDDIHVCKECEYRYNCTDCRAFRLSSDILSKPSKCKYNPRTSTWE